MDAELVDFLRALDDVNAPSVAADAQDVEHDLHACSMRSPCRPTHRVASKKMVSRSVLCRRRQRDEIDRLGQEARTLSEELGQLRERSTAARMSTVCCVWERIARHQRELRRQAEIENESLKAALETQRRALLRIYRQLRSSAAWHADVTRPESQLVLLPSISPALMRRLQEESRHIDARMRRHSSFWCREGDNDQTQVWICGDRTICFESLQTRVFPFDLEATSAAAWRIYSANRFELASGHYAAVVDSEAFLRARFELLLTSERVEAEFVVHRFHDKDRNRVVYVWEDASDGESRTSLVCTSGLLVLEAHESVGGSVSTVLKWHSLTNARADVSGHIDDLRELMADTTRRFQQKIESFVLDDALRISVDKV